MGGGPDIPRLDVVPLHGQNVEPPAAKPIGVDHDLFIRHGNGEIPLGMGRVRQGRLMEDKAVFPGENPFALAFSLFPAPEAHEVHRAEIVNCLQSPGRSIPEGVFQSCRRQGGIVAV